jgi:isocitrate/isopropylmalate dehydrogenase
MLLACAAVLDHAAANRDADQEDPDIARAAHAIRQTTLSVAADGIRTFDLGGDESTSGVVDEVLRRLRHALTGAA